MTTIRESLESFLSQRGWHWQRHTPGIGLAVHGHHGVWPMLLTWNEDDRWICCHSMLPFAIPKKHRAAVAEYAVRCNQGLLLGNFELRWADGEVAYKTSLRVQSDELTVPMLEDLLDVNCAMTDRYLPGFQALVFGRRSVRHALKLVDTLARDSCVEALAGEYPPC